MQRATSLCLTSFFALLSIATPSVRGVVVSHQYDFEPGNGVTATGPSVTQAGWTHMDLANTTNGTNPGFTLIAPTSIYYRGGSTQSPTDVTNDAIAVTGPGSGSPSLKFRDIVPAWATSVTFKVYRSDPGDNFFDDFRTDIDLSGNPGIEFTDNPGLSDVGFYHAPISGSFAMALDGNTRTLDFVFTDGTEFGTNSFIRLNGIEAIYAIPEPASAGMTALILGIACSARRRSGRVL